MIKSRKFSENQNIEFHKLHEVCDQMREVISLGPRETFSINIIAFTYEYLEPIEEKPKLKKLNDKSAYYRIEIARNWASKKVPQLKFVHDKSHEKAYELTHLIDNTLSNY